MEPVGEKDRRAEEGETPHAVGHSLRHREGPRLAVQKKLPPGNLDGRFRRLAAQHPYQSTKFISGLDPVQGVRASDLPGGASFPRPDPPDEGREAELSPGSTAEVRTCSGIAGAQVPCASGVHPLCIRGTWLFPGSGAV